MYDHPPGLTGKAYRSTFTIFAAVVLVALTVWAVW